MYMSLTNIINQGFVSSDYLNLRCRNLTIDDNLIVDTADINNLNIDNLNINSLSVDNLNVNNLTCDTADISNLNVQNEINAYDLIASNDIAGLTVSAATVVNTPDIVVTGITTTNSLNVTFEATLPPISFIGSSTYFDFDSVVLNVNFDTFTSANVLVGSAVANIRFTTIGNIYSLNINISSITASTNFQYFKASNPGIPNPANPCFCSIITNSAGNYYNGYVIIDTNGNIIIYRDAINGDFDQSAVLIPYSTIFYSLN
jgi:hypothetical protein